ncbi:hypothetical protein CQW23_13923 [Capsicum baccatum]|uniref:Uncharacterized protein n=1 Tax=Capsicum baccatum TaxID=33114 RepID=A0A2G2WHP2_CAPBA|nr:hypothetical protein CQW23_13923 [Capsicum baccatum]
MNENVLEDGLDFDRFEPDNAKDLENVTIEVKNQSEAAACELKENAVDDHWRRRDIIYMGIDSRQWKKIKYSDSCDLKTWVTSPKSLADTRELQNNKMENQNSSIVSEWNHTTTLTIVSSMKYTRLSNSMG